MRRQLLLLSLPFLGLSCFDTGDLGDVTKFGCSRDYPECPRGYICCGVDDLDGDGRPDSCPTPANLNRCVREPSQGGGGDGLMVNIPKAGIYTGPFTDLGLNSSNCPDGDFEPNNNIGHAMGRNPLTAISQIEQKVFAICPEGDVDVYTVDLNGQHLWVEMTAAIMNGDLDIALLNTNGDVTPYFDSGLMDKSCLTTPKLSGTYYLYVAGAKNGLGKTATNRYKLSVKTSTSSMMPCGGSPPDMSMGGADLAE